MSTTPISSPDLLSPEEQGGSPLASDLTSRAGLDVLVGQSFSSTAPAGSRHGSSVGSAANGTNDANGNGGAASERTQVYVVPADSSSRSLRFHVATIAPLVATYAAVLKFACVRLREGAAHGRADFSIAALRWIRESSEGQASAVGAVASQLIVQHAVEALVEAGCLQAQHEGVSAAACALCPCSAMHCPALVLHAWIWMDMAIRITEPCFRRSCLMAIRPRVTGWSCNCAVYDCPSNFQLMQRPFD